MMSFPLGGRVRVHPLLSPPYNRVIVVENPLVDELRPPYVRPINTPDSIRCDRRGLVKVLAVP